MKYVLLTALLINIVSSSLTKAQDSDLLGSQPIINNIAIPSEKPVLKENDSVVSYQQDGKTITLCVVTYDTKSGKLEDIICYYDD